MKKQATKKINQHSAWLYLLPPLLVIVIFNIYPLIKSFVLSFKSGTLFNSHFTGFENYNRLFHDPVFWSSIGHTALYTFTVVPIALIIALAIAWIIFDKVKHKSFFETIFFTPYVTSVIAIGIVFRYFFNDSYGIINYIFKILHLPTLGWLNDPNVNMLTLIIFGIWTSLAFNIIILLAGLHNINEEHYQIADLFGASKREIFFRITLPQLMPSITFLLTVNIINAFKVYNQVYALFGGKAGTANSASTAVFYIYDNFHIKGNPGLAMAATVILFIIILICTLIQQKLLKKAG